MDADLVKIEEMVMKGEEVTSTDPSDVKIEEPYRPVVIPQPPVIQPCECSAQKVPKWSSFSK